MIGKYNKLLKEKLANGDKFLFNLLRGYIMFANRSMVQKLLIAINALVLVLITALGVFTLLRTQGQMEEALQIKVNSLKEALASASVSYIWNLETEPLNAMAAMIMRNDRDIASLEFYSPDGKLLSKKIDVGSLEVHVDEIDIIREKEKIGIMKIGHTDKRIQDDIRAMIVTYTLFILMIMVILAICVTVITKGILKPVYTLIEDLRHSSQVLSETSTRLTRSGTELSAQVEDQASALQETSASLEELTGMVTANLNDSEKSTVVSNEVQNEANEGKRAMQDLVKSMQDVMRSNEEIQELVKVIGAIGEKTQVIDEIVFQTKLLSFNASVEAERAGEHGRGFAVVAQEVGNLAQLSGKAAVEISEIVKGSIQTAESITKSNREKVVAGNKLVESVAHTLEKVAEKSQVSSVSVGQIFKASKEQSIGLDQINTAVTTLDQNMHGNTRVARETAEIGEEMEKQATKLNQIVGNLSCILSGECRAEVRPTITRTPPTGGSKRKGPSVKEGPKVKTESKAKPKEEETNTSWQQI